MNRKKKVPQFDFTVIAGNLKGKRIIAPDLGITRPPLSRLRKAIFDFLTPYLEDASYLDLFSGTGSYLFEAVSRGVVRAVGVELDERLAETINRQARSFGVADRLFCRNGDVFTEIERLYESDEPFDIIMMAPPQYEGLIDQTLARLIECPLSTPDGLIICQHDSSETDAIDLAGFSVVQRRKYGNTTFTVLTVPEE